MRPLMRNWTEKEVANRDIIDLINGRGIGKVKACERPSVAISLLFLSFNIGNIKCVIYTYLLD
jgi:hypothetical protein